MVKVGIRAELSSNLPARYGRNGARKSESS